jgi:uncharacterized membrane protein (DUF373 family)
MGTGSTGSEGLMGPESPGTPVAQTPDIDINALRSYQLFGKKVTPVFQYGVKIALSLLLAVILTTIFWATFKTLLDLKVIFGQDIPSALKHVMVNSLTILAMLELFMTTLAYFSEGRVKVSYIIDTVLVVILTEIMTFWYKDIEYMRIVMVIALILTLITARIFAIRFSPPRLKENS